MIRDVALTRAEEELLNAFQAACAAAAALDGSRAWELRRRRRLVEELGVACELADEARDRVAAMTGGYTGPPRPTVDVIAEALAAVR